MNRKCCYVPSCSYDGISSTHCLPKKNPQVAKQLLQDLGFDEKYVPPPSFRVCRQHFTDDSIVASGHKLRLISTPKLKNVSKQRITICDEDSVGGFQEFKQVLPERIMDFTERGWKIISKETKVYIFWQELDEERGMETNKNIVINRYKHVTAFFKGRKVKIDERVSRKQKRSATISNWTDLKLVIESLEKEQLVDSDDICKEASELLDMIEPETTAVERKIKILQCQLRHLVQDAEAKSRRNYSIDTMLMSLQLFNISPACYRSMAKYFILPHERTLHRLSSSFDSMDSEKYFKELVKTLKPNERIVGLQVDEIYVKEGVNYKGGRLIGFADSSKEGDSAGIGKTAYGFLIESIFGSMKEVVELWPISGLNGEQLKKKTLDVIKFLADKGFTVVCVSADNNRLNQNLFKLLTTVSGGELNESFPNPHTAGDIIFVKYDAVHLIKNIRNCLLRAKQIFFPSFEEPLSPELKIADIADMRSLYRKQSAQTLKTAHKLTYKAVFVSNFDRQKVFLVDQLFHDSTIAALMQEGFSATAEFVKTVRTWWNVQNVKSKNAGKRKRDDSMKPIISVDDQQLEFLRKFVIWIDALMTNEATKEHRFTKDTYEALKQSTNVTIRLAEYLLPKFKPDYLLTSKFQTDQLERYFGKQRTMAGNQFRVSMVQVEETQKKLRVRKILKFKLRNSDDDDETENEQEGPRDSIVNEELLPFLDIIGVEADDEAVEVDEEAIAHVAGYCANAVVKLCNRKQGGCQECIERFTAGEKGDFDGSLYQANIQRGGLWVASETAKSLASYGVNLLHRLTNLEDFKDMFYRSRNQKKILQFLLMNAIESIFDDDDTCSGCGVRILTTFTTFASSLANTLLKGKGTAINNGYEIGKEKERIERQHKSEASKKRKAEKDGEPAHHSRKSQFSQHKFPLPFQSSFQLHFTSPVVSP